MDRSTYTHINNQHVAFLRSEGYSEEQIAEENDNLQINAIVQKNAITLFSRLETEYKNTGIINPLLMQQVNDPTENHLFMYLSAPSISYDIAFLNLLIDNQLDIALFRMNKACNNILIFPCRTNNFPLVQWLIEKCGLKMMRNPDVPTNHPLILAKSFAGLKNYLIQQMPAQTPYHDTALMTAAFHGDLYLCKTILKAGVDIDATNDEGQTALMLAAMNNYPAIVDFLLNNNAALMVKDKSDKTVFNYVFEINQTIFEQIVCHQSFEIQKIQANSIQVEAGRHILHWAISQNKTALISRFLSTTSHYLLDNVGRNLAVFACVYGNRDLATQLVAEGLDLHALSHSGKSALHYCVEEDAFLSANWLINKQGFSLEQYTSQGESALLLAVRLNKFEFIADCLKKSLISPVTLDNVGNMLGHYLAALNPSPHQSHTLHQLMETLISKSHVFLTHRNLNNQTMLDVALEKNNCEAARLCIRRIRQKQEKSLMVLSQIQKLPHLLDLFCGDMKNKNLSVWGDNCLWVEQGQTALHIACLLGDRNIIKSLIEKFKLNVNEPNAKGETPLALMMNQGLTQLALWYCAEFTKYQLKIAQVDTRGSTLLHLACEQQSLAVAKLCIHRGASIIKTRSGDNASALQIAIEQQNYQLVDYLLSEVKTKDEQTKIKALQIVIDLHDTNVIREIWSTWQVEDESILLKAFILGIKLKNMDVLQDMWSLLEERQIQFIIATVDEPKRNLLIQNGLFTPAPLFHSVTPPVAGVACVAVKKNKKISNQSARNVTVVAPIHVVAQNTLDTIERDEFIQMIESHNVQSLKKLKNSPLLFEKVSSWAAHGLTLALERADYAVLGHLLRIPAIYKTITEPSLLLYVIQRNDMTGLKRLLRSQRVKVIAHLNQNEVLCSACQSESHEMVAQLLQVPTIKDTAHVDNRPLQIAAEHDRYDTLLELLKIEAVREHAHENENSALRCAVDNVCIDIIFELLLLENVQQALAENNFELFRYVIDKSNPEITECFLKSNTIRSFINDNAEYQYLLINEDVAYQETQGSVPYQLQYMMQQPTFYPNPMNIAYPFFPVVHTIPVYIYQYVPINNYMNFTPSYWQPQELAITLELEFQELQDKLRLQNKNLSLIDQFFIDNAAKLPTCFCQAAHDLMYALVAKGETRLIEHLLKQEWMKPYACSIQLISLSASKGFLKILRVLLSEEGAAEQIANEQNQPLRFSAKEGHIEVVKYLLSYPLVVQNAAALNNYALRMATRNGHLKVVELLIGVDVVFQFASKLGNGAFRCAVMRSLNHFKPLTINEELISTLLSIPVVFYQAAHFLPKYNAFIDPFVLHEVENIPDNISNIKLDLYFYILLYLVRKNDEQFNLHLQKLLENPNIKNIAHSRDRKLLRDATRYNNLFAKTLLKDIPLVAEPGLPDSLPVLVESLASISLDRIREHEIFTDLGGDSGLQTSDSSAQAVHVRGTLFYNEAINNNQTSSSNSPEVLAEQIQPIVGVN